jgi:large subunit ribosomal protein L18
MNSILNAFKRRRYRNRLALRKKSSRFRLSVFRSTKNIYAQIIDDAKGITLVSSSSIKLKDNISNIDIAHKIGRDIASKAISNGIYEVVFDRGAYLYHGRVKSLADGARAGGLKF